jgi:hypothetical protein
MVAHEFFSVEIMTIDRQESELLESLRARGGLRAIKWTLFIILVGVTYTAFVFGLLLTIARIDGEFVGEVRQINSISHFHFHRDRFILRKVLCNRFSISGNKECFFRSLSFLCSQFSFQSTNSS